MKAGEGNGWSQRRFCSRWPGGFTLVELLVVIAIIAVLAAILLPSLGKAKSSALAIACMNNQAQITKGWYMYATDSNDVLPPNSTEGIVYGQWASGTMWFLTDPDNGWQDTTNYGLLDNSFTTSGYVAAQAHILNQYPPYPLLTGKFSVLPPYLPSYKVYKCPADSATIDIFGTPYPRVRSYAMNIYVGPMADNPNVNIQTSAQPAYFTYVKMSAFKNPSQTFVLLDVSSKDTVWGDFQFIEDFDSFWGSGPNSIPTATHNSAGTFSFADGHVILKHWKDPRTATAAWGGGTDENPVYVNLEQPNNPDMQWLRTVLTARRDGSPIPLSVPPSP